MQNRGETDQSISSDGTGLLAVRLFRASQRTGPLGRVFQALLRFGLGVELPRQTQVGYPLDLPHGSRGLTVHWDAKIGDRVTLHHNVTLGTRVGGGPAPTLGDRVNVGAGAVVLGGITIGDGATVGANAVVLKDVPAGAVAVGNPARIIEK